MHALRNRTAVLFVIWLMMSVAASASADPASDAAAIKQLVADWAAAWQAGRFDEYAAYYVAGYRGDEASPDRWRTRRRARIAGRSDIRIELGPVLIELHQDNPDVARAVFLQSYRSDRWCDVVEKTLTLRRATRGWRIDGERSVTRRRC